MATFSLLDVDIIQSILRSSGIVSAVTGDVGMSYHGVDVVTHDLEICIPAALRDAAIHALEETPQLYTRLDDEKDPDFYHPFKRNVARFRMLRLASPLELHLIADAELDLDITNATLESGLTPANANFHLWEFCEDVPASITAPITWVPLSLWLNAWLRLANQTDLKTESGGNAHLIYMMYAERLVDGGDVDFPWCEKEVPDAACRELALKLVRGKQSRILGSFPDPRRAMMAELQAERNLRMARNTP